MARLTSWLRQTRVQRLTLALGFSLLVHWVLLGSVQLHLFESEPHQTLEARLVVKPPPAAKPVVEKPAEKRVRKPTLKPRQPSVLPPPEVTQTQENEALPPAILPNQAPSLDADNPPIDENSTREPEEVVAESTDIEINLHPYQRIETMFDVRTEFDARVNSSAAGKAKIVFELSQKNTQYQIKSLIQAKGLAALFIGDLLQTSQGAVTTTGLQPQHYVYQFNNNQNKTFSADFDWTNQILALNKAGSSKQVRLEEGTQDLLSFMYQFMFVAPLQTMQINITNGKKLAVYEYSFEGEELIDTKMGKVNTIHLQRATIEDKKTDLWLALDYQYVPVKIRETEKDGKVYELLVTELNTIPSP
ncbi:MAG: DUF3108 domain-containing protein [Methylotenera sp.]|nr:DUF3108 domain-containing protein [Methylotenera sp.]